MICFYKKTKMWGNPDSGIREIFACEIAILGMRTTAQGIRNRTWDWNPESYVKHWQNLESNTWDPGPKKKVHTGKSDITGRLFFITYD